jgi:polyketide cyclase/dehydrase/lipid transport protein
MASFEFSESATIPAPPERAYAVIADYVNGHPHILPKKVFQNLRVEAGGYGAGTRIAFEMRLLGATQTLRSTITEPEPGRVLVEAYPETGSVTTFLVDPEPDANHCRVTFHTRMTVRGFAGWLQPWLVPRLLRPVYQEELQNLAEFSQHYTPGSSAR